MVVDYAGPGKSTLSYVMFHGYLATNQKSRWPSEKVLISERIKMSTFQSETQLKSQRDCLSPFSSEFRMCFLLATIAFIVGEDLFHSFDRAAKARCNSEDLISF
jgi:hypothetical protein